MTSRAYILLFCLLALSIMMPAQEVPLERCDRLHVIRVTAGGQPYRFLVDTGATSLLNLQSFANGRSKDVEVSSWAGTLATSAREVTLSELVIGDTHLLDLKLAAIDLSAIG